jgi:hypothetical protein
VNVIRVSYCGLFASRGYAKLIWPALATRSRLSSREFVIAPVPLLSKIHQRTVILRASRRTSNGARTARDEGQLSAYL